MTFKLRAVTFLISMLLQFLSVQTVCAQDYQIVWSDEFDGDVLNSSDWTRETGGHGWGNNELQFYTNRESNASVADGILTITALKENYNGRAYTSARLKTQGKKFWQYGKIEARIKLPTGKGLWPAFWMLGESISSIGWPACGEIDIMEFIGGGVNEKYIHGTAHWEQNGHASYGGSYSLSTGIFADDFHIFSIAWTPKQIEWYIDNQKYHTIDITPSGLSEFHDNLFIILNIAVGGDWPGSPDATTVFPQKMEVDYVRVYQDAASLPVVTIRNPLDQSSFDTGSDITIDADIEYSGEIDMVKFYQGSMQIGETDLYPYRLVWRDVQSGAYQISALAESDKGYEVQSQAINVAVGDDFQLAPYPGFVHIIPGSIEAEDFDICGSENAYSDSDISNNGQQYRPDEGVDIEKCSDINGGFNVGWTAANEWLKYSIHIRESADYDFDVRVANNGGSGVFHFELDGNDISGPISFTSTGGWQNWTSLKAQNISLTEGFYELKLVIDAGNFNINNFEISKSGAEPEIELIAPAGGEAWAGGSIQEIRWFSSKMSSLRIRFSTDAGKSWTSLSSNSPAKFGTFRWKIDSDLSDSCIIRVQNRLKSNQYDQNAIAFSIVPPLTIEDPVLAIKGFELKQNYPNPFNPSTSIAFYLPEAETVQLTLFDYLGRQVALLQAGYLTAGFHRFILSSDQYHLSSGVYYYQLKSPKNIQTKKMILLR